VVTSSATAARAGLPRRRQRDVAELDDAGGRVRDAEASSEEGSQLGRVDVFGAVVALERDHDIGAEVGMVHGDGDGHPHSGVVLELSFEAVEADEHATPAHDVVAPTVEEQVAVRIDAADVAGTEPTVVEGGRRFVAVVEVARGDDVAADEDLAGAVVRPLEPSPVEAQLDPERASDRSRWGGAVERHTGDLGHLGHAVALQDRGGAQRCPEAIGQPRMQGRSPGAQVADRRRQPFPLVGAEGLEQAALSRYVASPMDPMAAAHALVRSLPPGTAVVDEAITTGVYVRGFHHDAVPDRYFFNRGAGLGWGMPMAVGLSLGRGSEPVLGVVGDGAAMYSPQALWTAANEDLPVVFAVVNNRQYLILKNNLREMGGESIRHDRFVAMDIDDPPVDYVALAGSMGVEATLVEKADDVGDAVRAAFASGRPHLLELPIAVP
jgi:Thiamine pyrophosphate enzyme, C-terminal TPP binding domain